MYDTRTRVERDVIAQVNRGGTLIARVEARKRVFELEFVQRLPKATRNDLALKIPFFEASLNTIECDQ